MHSFYDDLGNYRIFINGGNFSNQENPSEGILTIPNVLRVGDSWSREGIESVFLNQTFVGSFTENIIKMETIRVPFGGIETYVFDCIGTYYATYDSVPLLLTEQTTTWVHPRIGIVKEVTVMELRAITSDELLTTSHYGIELSSINWEVDSSLEFDSTFTPL